MHDHGVAVADERQQLVELRAGGVLAGGFVYRDYPERKSSGDRRRLKPSRSTNGTFCAYLGCTPVCIPGGFPAARRVLSEHWPSLTPGGRARAVPPRGTRRSGTLTCRAGCRESPAPESGTSRRARPPGHRIVVQGGLPGAAEDQDCTSM